VKTVLWGFVAGATLAVSLAFLGFVVFPGSSLTEAFLAPAGILLPVLGRLVPQAVTYALVPSGGAPAGVLLILVSALAFWLLLGMCLVAVVRKVSLRRRKPAA